MGATLRPMRRRLMKVVIGILLLPFLVLALLVFEGVRGRLSLAHYRRALLAQGEILSPLKLSQPSTNGDNGAPEVLAAIRELKVGSVLPTNYSTGMKWTPSGRAIVSFREEEWVENNVTNNWDQLEADLEANKAILTRIRAALKKPVLVNSLDLGQGFKLLIPHLAPAKSLTYWFHAGSQLALHDGQTHSALDHLIAETHLTRMLAEDRLMISELVRIAICAMARNSAWEAIQADGWKNEDLTALQKAWEEQRFIPGMVRALQGELIYGQTSFEMMRKSNADAVQMVYGLEKYMLSDDSERPWWERTLREFSAGDKIADFLKEQVYCRLWRYVWLDQNERHYLEQTKRLLEIARKAAVEKSFSTVQPAIIALEQELSAGNWYDRLRYPGPSLDFGLPKAVSRAIRAETERSITICAIALKRYLLEHGAPPPQLEELVPRFISAVPIDPMDGKSMKYQTNSDGTFRLYSVGTNGRDDGGATTLLPGKTSLKNPWDTKDFFWPSPALPDEVQEYRKESAKK